MHYQAPPVANLLGAASLAVADAVRDAVEKATGFGGALPAALVTIDAYPLRSMEALRIALGISQPGVLRLVERLETEGWVRRRPAKGRAVALELTPSGRRTVAKLLSARENALAALLEPLSSAERRQLTPLLAKLLAAQTHDRGSLERLCRLCQRPACRHCPVAGALRGGA
jgi:MarR family transcriptional regulator, negative regulator of the multidrug operon emrRAB